MYEMFIKATEQRCKTIRMGEVPYSPEITILGKRLEFWGTIIQHILGGTSTGAVSRERPKHVGLPHLFQGLRGKQ